MKKIISIIFIFLLLTACSIKINTPSDAVSNMLDAILNNNVTLFNEVTNSHLDSYILKDDNFYPDFTNMSDTEIAFYKALVPYIKKFTYTITEETIDNKQASVNVTITNYDITSCLQDIQQQALDQLKEINSTNIDDYYNLTIDLFKDNIENYLTLKHDITFNLKQTNQYYTVEIENPSEVIYSLFASIE